jgi:hypothetical protein
LSAGLALLAVSVVVGLYGLVALLYRGDNGGAGETYVTLGGRELDAQLVGAVALLISFVALLVAWMILWRPRRERSSS